MVVAFWSVVREGRVGDESIFVPYLAFDLLFDDFRELLLDLLALVADALVLWLS